jgi:putative phosphoribosyl transferase
MTPPFRDRPHAGRALGDALRERWAGTRPLVLGLPRGGVPVAAEVADALGAPLDVLVVRKLGLPRHPELAMGAIASGGVRVLNPAVLRAHDVTAAQIERVAAQELVELERRERAFRGDRPRHELTGRAVLLVDDGLATGATMTSAVEAIATAAPARVAVAVPVGAPDAVARLEQSGADVVCLHAPRDFAAVGAFYVDFTQTPDEQVRALLGR